MSAGSSSASQSAAAFLRRIVVTYRALQFVSHGSVIDPTRIQVSRHNGGHGRHGISSVRSPDYRTEVDAAEALLARVAVVLETHLAVERQGASARPINGDTNSEARRAETDAILAEVGREPTEVAYLYGKTTEGVRKLRLRHRRDPDTGEPVRERPLTAPPRDQLADLAFHDARLSEGDL